MKALVVAAHPDDEVLGCGGTMHRLAAEGVKISVLLLGAGVAARYDDPEQAKQEQEALEHATSTAADRLGVARLWRRNFPDNRFDTVALLEIAKAVEEIVDMIEPEVVFTHHLHDLNVDHRLTAQAVLTATRPQPGNTLRDVYTFPVLSSTEWAFGLDAFHPRRFIQLDNADAQAKLEALEAYGSEMRPFPHRRSLLVASTELTWYGSMMGVEMAEAFDLLRSLRPLPPEGADP